MDTDLKHPPYQLEELIPQMMEEIIRLKAEKNAVISMMGYMFEQLNLPQQESSLFSTAFVDMVADEHLRLLSEHPWFEAYWMEKLKGITA